MTRETKAGLVVSCSFLCLVGVVLFNKVNENEARSTKGGDNLELVQTPDEPQPVPTNHVEASTGKGAPFARVQVAEHQAADGVVPATYRTSEERESSSPKVPFPAPAKEPAGNERALSSSPAVNGSGGPAMPSPTLKLEKSAPTIHSPPLAKTTDATPGSAAKSLAEKPAPEPQKAV